MTSARYEVVRTRAGARALLDHVTGEVMHPVVGPLIEAEQLYIRPSRLEHRLASAQQPPLVVLDIGLGAGSNAAAAFRVSAALPQACRRLQLVSFDCTLEPLASALSTEHAADFGFDAMTAKAGRALLEQGRYDSARTLWRMSLGDLLVQLACEPEGSADIVFWDPFSPRQNPALWSLAAFRALRRLCREGATVHTYSAATATRSALLLAGFAVGLGGAAAGKQPQTTVAALHPAQLEQPLDRRFLARLTRSSAPFPADAPKDALRQIEQLPQFAESV
jgi:queuine tRNA-ribosyltransferase